MDNEPKLVSFREIVGPGLALVPRVGRTLAATWAEWETVRQMHHVRDTLDVLIRLLARLDPPLSAGKLGEDDMQILDMALQRTQFARAEEKRIGFARLVAASWTDFRELPFEERVIFIEALSAFHERHLRTLWILRMAGSQQSVAYRQLRDQVVSDISSLVEKNSIMIPILERLAVQFAFIHRAWSSDEDIDQEEARPSGRDAGPEAMARHCRHWITPLGERFLAALEPH